MTGPVSRRQLIQAGLAAGLIAGDACAGGARSVSARPGSQRVIGDADARPIPQNDPVAAAARTRAQTGGRIRMYVYIRNETDATLTLTGEEVVSGEYTPGWTPPRQIAPGERRGFQGEGDLFLTATTGTEGRVRYNIDAPDGGELYVHWNSPLIESQYGNTFHVWAPPGWEVTHSGGQGHRATLEIRLRRTALRSVPNFHPNGRGFVFTNSWSGDLPVISLGFLWNKLFESQPGPLRELGYERVLDDDFGPITHADTGLCGGMVYAVMDYHASHLLPPDRDKPPTAADDPVFEYVRDRLWDSFDVGGQGHRYLGYSSPHYPNGDEGVVQAVGLTRGRSWVTYREAFPQIQADIDAGRLSPLGLIQTDSFDIGQNHQVLAYGYEKSGQDVTLHIYDPNEGQKAVTYRFNVTRTDGEVHIDRSHGGKRIWCLFRTNGYVAKMPPNGRRIASVTEAIRATTAQTPPYSVRAAMAEAGATGSVVEWMRSL